MKIEVTRSARRRKTVQARMVDGVLQVAIPGHMSASEEDHWVGVMRAKFERRQDTAKVNLEDRGRELSAAFELPEPSEISWSDRQKTLWGSCTPSTGRVRIASRVAAYPEWVLDYVIIHELAHLVESDHGTAFWDLVARYPMAERARGYLQAKNDAAS
ncbi:MAG: M48 family metallopeptidase [bacterium]|nr:M48 family metallopeptidase [bacterium]